MVRNVFLLLVGPLLWAGCSSSSDAGGLDCRERSDRDDPRDGCYCETLAAGSTPDYPKVARCDKTYAGASTTLCCRTSKDCVCYYVGCETDSLLHSCTCGADEGDAILSTQAEVSSCALPTNGRCCVNTSEGYCECDSDSTGCGAQYGDVATTSCGRTTAVARCPEGDEVDSCGL